MLNIFGFYILYCFWSLIIINLTYKLGLATLQMRRIHLVLRKRFASQVVTLYRATVLIRDSYSFDSFRISDG